MEEIMTVSTEPRTYKQAEKHPKWQQAMMEEWNEIVDNRTWILVVKPSKNTKVIDTKWVYMTKLNVDGSVSRYKARLVVRGYKQDYGVDYEKTYAPVARLDTFRMLLALVASNSWKVYQMDVKSVILNGVLKEEVYLK
ncbi:uncharacterized mitochondrial protein AtMg00820-like [Rutidosis leptorrhynchoides]|uniref:uncharacterized mitochondrial protein AtMg00820-like n=1 Tax=Rutidosis leptorrhynchoides TaxID=125765 RepID=UPI003A99336A